MILWRSLRTRPAGYKFRRQHPIGPYVLDFTCLSARLAVEIDGEAHGRAGAPEHDARRDADLAARGFMTLRVPARDVLVDLAAVVDLIVETSSRAPLHQPAAGPPPRTGGVCA